MSTQFRARFTPQAWQNDYAITVDPQGDTTWDCTEFLGTFDSDARAEALLGHNYAADELRHDPSAPEWIREWQGPFEIDVEVYEVQAV